MNASFPKQLAIHFVREGFDSHLGVPLPQFGDLLVVLPEGLEVGQQLLVLQHLVPDVVDGRPLLAPMRDDHH